MKSPSAAHSRSIARRRLPAVATMAALVAITVGLAACGGDGKSATQVAAKVNSEEISVHQINFILQRTPGLTAERAPGAKKAILERLIEQEVLVQAADEGRLDRDPDVLQRLEATRREVLARAHLERIAAAVQKPDADEIKAFFAAQPQLFQNRKVYKFHEIGLQGRPTNWSEIEKALQPAKTIQEAAVVLREHKIDPTIATNVTRASEQLPLAMLPQFERVKEGDLVVYPQATGIVIAQVQTTRAEPVDEKRAGPVIEQFLLNKKRNEVVQAELERLRKSAKVTYVGEFEGSDKAAAAARAVAPASPQTSPANTAARQQDGIDKGLKGLK